MASIRPVSRPVLAGSRRACDPVCVGCRPVAQIALLPLTTPRAASVDQLREQLAAGEVTAVFFGDRVDPASSGRVAPVTHGLSVAANRPALT